MMGSRVYSLCSVGNKVTEIMSSGHDRWKSLDKALAMWWKPQNCSQNIGCINGSIGECQRARRDKQEVWWMMNCPIIPKI